MLLLWQVAILCSAPTVVVQRLVVTILLSHTLILFVGQKTRVTPFSCFPTVPLLMEYIS